MPFTETMLVPDVYDLVLKHLLLDGEGATIRHLAIANHDMYAICRPRIFEAIVFNDGSVKHAMDANAMQRRKLAFLRLVTMNPVVKGDVKSIKLVSAQYKPTWISDFNMEKIITTLASYNNGDNKFDTLHVVGSDHRPMNGDVFEANQWSMFASFFRAMHLDNIERLSPQIFRQMPALETLTISGVTWGGWGLDGNIPRTLDRFSYAHRSRFIPKYEEDEMDLGEENDDEIPCVAPFGIPRKAAFQTEYRDDMTVMLTLLGRERTRHRLESLDIDVTGVCVEHSDRMCAFSAELSSVQSMSLTVRYDGAFEVASNPFGGFIYTLGALRCPALKSLTMNMYYFYQDAVQDLKETNWLDMDRTLQAIHTYSPTTIVTLNIQPWGALPSHMEWENGATVGVSYRPFYRGQLADSFNPMNEVEFGKLLPTALGQGFLFLNVP